MSTRDPAARTVALGEDRRRGCQLAPASRAAPSATLITRSGMCEVLC